MQQVCIVDAQAVCSLGDNLDEIWKSLYIGKTAIKPVTRFETKNYTSNLAACINDLKASNNNSLIHSLLEKLFKNLKDIPKDPFILTASTKSGIDNLELIRKNKDADYNDLFLFNLPHIVSKKLGLPVSGINISAACASSTIAAIYAYEMIAFGQISSAVICFIDIVTEFVFSGFSSLKALSKKGANPFDKNRDGLTIGEGAGIIILMSEERAKKEGRKILAKIIGSGIANDATHVTAPAKDGCGLIYAIKKGLDRAILNPKEIDAISAHGTGTVYNDKMELTAFENVFKDIKIPIHSVKGAIGHTLGAAGGIEIAIGVKTILNQTVPPTCNLIDPEYDFIFNKPIEIPIKYLLKTNSGFGGINAALILARNQ
ncbi:MAG: beta-ketoacyl-[acyl-carrier-protein] synthase family protein [Desulfobacterales bacterium]|nr:beta-ketoacyl-[acyl-carrier-protein] synthase family protein [Desulfobacterales bacterium]